MHGSQRSTDSVKQRFMAVTQRMPSDFRQTKSCALRLRVTVQEVPAQWLARTRCKHQAVGFACLTEQSGKDRDRFRPNRRQAVSLLTESLNAVGGSSAVAAVKDITGTTRPLFEGRKGQKVGAEHNVTRRQDPKRARGSIVEARQQVVIHVSLLHCRNAHHFVHAESSFGEQERQRRDVVAKEMPASQQRAGLGHHQPRKLWRVAPQLRFCERP